MPIVRVLVDGYEPSYVVESYRIACVASYYEQPLLQLYLAL
jgi:hypothetical protein